jgi:hypothetical protein
VQALSPISRALWKEAMTKAGRLESIAPQVWTLPWNVPSQATPHAHAALPDRAPYVFKVALAKRRLVSLTERTVPFTSRKPGRARLRTTTLDAMAFLRRFLHHVLPDGFMKVRHFGFLPASCPLPPGTLRLLLVPAQLIDFPPTRLAPPAPFVACCPTWGGPLQVGMRLWTANSACVDTGGARWLCQHASRSTWFVQRTGTRAPASRSQTAKGNV